MSVGGTLRPHGAVGGYGGRREVRMLDIRGKSGSIAMMLTECR